LFKFLIIYDSSKSTSFVTISDKLTKFLINFDLFFFFVTFRCSNFEMFIALKFIRSIVLHPVACTHYTHRIFQLFIIVYYVKKHLIYVIQYQLFISHCAQYCTVAILYLLQSRHSYWCSRGRDRDLRRLEKETGSLERPPIANTTLEASNGLHYRE